MNLVNMLTRRDPLKRAFVTLEDGMTDVLNEEFMLPPDPTAEKDDLDMDGPDTNLDPDATDVRPDVRLATQIDDNSDRITAHTQNRLAGYASFDEARSRTNEDLSRIGEALSNIVASHHLSREFLNDCYADIHRANELEIANATFATDNRRLTERVEKLEKLRVRYDQLIDVLKRRESKLVQDAETMRESLGALKLEVVEARNTIARTESAQGELQVALASRTSEAERYQRDSEFLREKNITLALDLDIAQKKQAETRRKLEDLSAVHASDTARIAELLARLSSEENESSRLLKLNDTLEARLVEAEENASQLSVELADREKRFQSENQALKAENQALAARMQSANAEQRETESELATMRARLGDVETEKQILEKKFTALSGELENERRVGMTATSPQGDQAELLLHRKQTEQMRGEIEVLQETVAQLRQYESIYTAAKARAKARSEVTDGLTVSNDKTAPDFVEPVARRA